MQIIGVAVASVIMAPILQLLHENTPGGIGGRELAAPQAGLFASLADGFFGEGNLPLDMVAIGAVLGILILIADSTIFNKNKFGEFRLHLMPIAVGMYLPFGLSTPILAGGLLAYFISKRSISTEKINNSLQNGVLLSSGLIAGESLMGILLALLASAGVKSMNLGLQPNMITGLTFISVIIMIWWLYKNSSLTK
jgi:putative OPT family oligopeptide transporter